MTIADEIAHRLQIERAIVALSHQLAENPALARELSRRSTPAKRRPKSFPIGARWRWTRGGGSPWRGDEADISCPTCGVKIASARVPKIKVVAADDGEERWEDSREVAIGLLVSLERGYVNARGRHSSGKRWYVVGKRTTSPLPKVRLPAIVTCRCTQAIELEGAESAEEAALYATANADTRSERLSQDLQEEAEDQFIQHEVDLARGK